MHPEENEIEIEIRRKKKTISYKTTGLSNQQQDMWQRGPTSLNAPLTNFWMRADFPTLLSPRTMTLHFILLSNFVILEICRVQDRSGKDKNYPWNSEVAELFRCKSKSHLGRMAFGYSKTQLLFLVGLEEHWETSQGGGRAILIWYCFPTRWCWQLSEDNTSPDLSDLLTW